MVNDFHAMGVCIFDRVRYALVSDVTPETSMIDARAGSRGPMTPRAWLALVGLLAFYWVLAFSSWYDKSATYDEPVHLVGGYTYWKYNDYRTNLENGVLPQRLMALPLLAMDLKPDTPRDTPYWQISRTMPIAEFFFNDKANPAQRMLRAGRAVMTCVGCAVIAVIFFWARRLWGSAGGWVAACAAALSPTMLAQGPLCTSDMTATLFFVLTVLLCWRAIHVATPGRIVLAGLAIAGLVTSKYSWPLALVMVLAMMAVRLIVRPTMAWRFSPRARWTRVGTPAKQACVMAGMIAIWAAVSITVVWAMFGFREKMVAPDAAPGVTMRASWEEIAGSPLAPRRVLAWIHDRGLLPEGYLWGAAWTVTSTQQRKSKLMDDYNVEGNRAFFPFLIATKTAPAVLMLLALGAGAALCVGLRRAAPATGSRWINRLPWIRRVYHLTPAAVLFLVYLTSAIFSHINLGHRHVLPIYPVFFVIVGACGLWLRSRPIPAFAPTAALRAATIACLVLLGVQTAAAYPNYLAYFNFFIGGPANARHYVVDSSLDWGQELINLKRWLEARGVGQPDKPRAVVAYFGTALPTTYAVPAEYINIVASFEPIFPPMPLHAGYYCISATLLEGVATTGFGPWDTRREAEYQKMLPEMNIFWTSKYDPQAKVSFDALLAKYSRAGWARKLAIFHGLRFERLCAFLRHREPMDNINYSIYIFDLSDDDLRAAFDGPPAELIEPRSTQ